MIKKLQKSFIRVALLSISAVLLFVAGLINGVNWLEITNRTAQVAMLIASNHGKFPEPLIQDRSVERRTEGFRPDDALATRYAVVSLKDGAVATVDTSHISELSEDSIYSMVDLIQKDPNEAGWQQHYRFAKFSQENTTWIAIVDAKREVDSAYRLLIISVMVFAGSLMVVALLIAYFSKRAIRPFVLNIQRQQEFISNASHEIKTPLAVLAANNDLLKMNDSENRWLASNTRQIHRLNELVEQMLLLSRYDEGSSFLQLETVTISPVLKELYQDFQPLLAERAVQLEMKVQQEAHLKVDRDSVKQLLRILVENAIKYTTNHVVQIIVNKHSIQVMNACDMLTREQLERLFERFYRVDSSRNRKIGGSGIGLAIAQSIAKSNKLKLNVTQTNEGTIIFTLQTNV